MSQATERFPLPELGYGHPFEQAVKLWILKQDPNRSPIVTDAEIGAAIKKYGSKKS